MALFSRLSRGRDADMTQGVIWKHLLSFSIPMALGLLFQQLYNTVDAVVVGRFVGQTALAAVGSVGSILNTLVGFCIGLSAGAGVVISQRYGAHDEEGLSDAVHTAISVTLILSVVTAALGTAIVTPMLHLMDMPESAFGEAKEYVTIYFLGIGGLLVYNMGSGILRAVGDARRPLYFLIFSALLNIAGDLLFVVGFHLGVAGVAYATILSQLCSAVLVMTVLTRTDAPYAIRWRRLRIARPMLRSIFSLGLPSGIQQAVTSFSNVFVQSYINYFDTACMAGWASYNKIDAFILIPVQSISLAAATFVGQNYGAGDLRRANKGVKQAMRMALAVTAILAVGVVLARRQLLGLFSEEKDVVEYGARFILLISPFYLMICFTSIYPGALRGIGSAKTPVAIMLVSFVLFRQAYLFANARLFGNSFILTSLAYPMGWVVCTILLMVFYRRSILCHPERAEGARSAYA